MSTPLAIYSTYLRCSSVSGKLINVIYKIKESRNKSGVAQRVPEGLGSQISMTFGI
jgi:hypothetical protein